MYILSNPSVSYIISDIYNHVIGPGPNSNIEMKSITPPILPSAKFYWKDMPITAFIMIIAT